MSYLVHKKETFLLFASWLPTLISKKKKMPTVQVFLNTLYSCCHAVCVIRAVRSLTFIARDYEEKASYSVGIAKY